MEKKTYKSTTKGLWLIRKNKPSVQLTNWTARILASTCRYPSDCPIVSLLVYYCNGDYGVFEMSVKDFRGLRWISELLPIDARTFVHGATRRHILTGIEYGTLIQAPIDEDKYDDLVGGVMEEYSELGKLRVTAEV